MKESQVRNALAASKILIEIMKVLQLNKELLGLYDIRGISDSRPWPIELCHLIIVTVMLICLVCGWSFSLAFIIMDLKTDLRDALYTAYTLYSKSPQSLVQMILF